MDFYVHDELEQNKYKRKAISWALSIHTHKYELK
jgi:hypothetical protein